MEKNRITGDIYIVKIAEAAINGEKEKAIRYITRYKEMFPELYLSWAFKNILEGNLNPNKLKLD